jgi:elongation factor P--(R)-beta-lysine ligase
MSLESKIEVLQKRALFLQKARLFFIEKGILEVDTPILSTKAPIDEHIDIMSVCLSDRETGYLHSSPEYAMKRLLSMGIKDIFQISHVFRKQEVGALHNPEFTMVEWYRVQKTFSFLIEETVDFVRLFLGPLPQKILSYRGAFTLFTGIDPFTATASDLLECAYKHSINLSSAILQDKDTLLHLLMGFVIEPHLGQQEITVITDYPASQAALAEIAVKDGCSVAKRFEIYYKGIELANGYQELTDAALQKARLEASNAKRASAGKPILPVDQNFLEALSKGMPPCCGVAAGFDRLFMLHIGANSLEEVLPFSWQEI